MEESRRLRHRRRCWISVCGGSWSRVLGRRIRKGRRGSCLRSCFVGAGSGWEEAWRCFGVWILLVV